MKSEGLTVEFKNVGWHLFKKSRFFLSDRNDFVMPRKVNLNMLQ